MAAAALLLSFSLAGAVEVGQKAPDFSLPGTDGKTHNLADLAGKKAVVIIFSCHHCPVVKAYEDRMIRIARDYLPKDVAFVAINPNDETRYPEARIEDMKRRAEEKKYPFPYLKNADSSVARAYAATVTPHVYVADSKLIVRYIGRIDDSRDPEKVERHDLREALDDLLAGNPVRVPTTKAFGCTIKWVR